MIARDRIGGLLNIRQPQLQLLQQPARVTSCGTSDGVEGKRHIAPGNGGVKFGGIEEDIDG